jgi:proteasome lid subunit RPN8/RPN11
LLLIEDVVLVRQLCTAVTVKFDDAAVADYFDDQVDQGRHPEECGRVWIHTHPGNSPFPSGTDEATFERCFGQTDWAVMFVLACGGRTYARLRFGAGPGGGAELPVEVDFGQPFPVPDPLAWEIEYSECVVVEPPGPSKAAVRLLDVAANASHLVAAAEDVISFPSWSPEHWFDERFF